MNSLQYRKKLTLMPRGRPPKSIIRDRMSEILNVLGASYGYEIYKIYAAAFSKISMRSMYYHLNKGVELREFNLIGMREEKGNYTWGDRSFRRYYVLDQNKKIVLNEELVRVRDGLGLKKRDPKRLSL